VSVLGPSFQHALRCGPSIGRGALHSAGCVRRLSDRIRARRNRRSLTRLERCGRVRSDVDGATAWFRLVDFAALEGSAQDRVQARSAGDNDG